MVFRFIHLIKVYRECSQSTAPGIEVYALLSWEKALAERKQCSLEDESHLQVWFLVCHHNTSSSSPPARRGHPVRHGIFPHYLKACKLDLVILHIQEVRLTHWTKVSVFLVLKKDGCIPKGKLLTFIFQFSGIWWGFCSCCWLVVFVFSFSLWQVSIVLKVEADFSPLEMETQKTASDLNGVLLIWTQQIFAALDHLKFVHLIHLLKYMYLG